MFNIPNEDFDAFPALEIFEIRRNRFQKPLDADATTDNMRVMHYPKKKSRTNLIYINN